MTDPRSSIDRPALERILQRAAELQTSERDIGDALTPADVLALGREVGIPGHYLQQAMLEEQNRVAAPVADGVLDKLAGPAATTAQRVVLGTVEDVSQVLLGYMETHELLCVQRQQPGRITWEPLGGFQAAIRRSSAAFGSGKRPFMLSPVRTVAATLMPLESGYVHVSLSADVRGLRSQFVGGAAAIASAGAAATAILAVLTPFLVVAVAPLPLALGVGYVVVRQYPPRLERVQLGLERALDHLQQGSPRKRELPPRPSGIVGLIADEVRKALKP